MSEARPPAPRDDSVWVVGYWRWENNRHVWNAGHWEHPPAAGEVWIAPEWVQQGTAYVFHPGRWVPATARTELPRPMPATVPTNAPPPPPVASGRVVAVPTTSIDVSVAPPRPRFERRAGTQPAGQTWVPRYWAWNGSTYLWTEGRWQTPPEGLRAWVAPRVVRHGRRWLYTPGFWR